MTKGNDKLQIYAVIACVCISIYSLISIVSIFPIGSSVSDFLNLAKSIILLITVGSVFYKRKEFVAILLLIIAVSYLISLGTYSFLVFLSFLSAAFIILYSNKNTNVAKKVFYIPALLYLSSVLVYVISRISLNYNNSIIYTVSNIIMIAGFLFLELWAVNYKTPSKETSGHIPTRNKGTEADRLLKLKELLDSGAITQEEYESKKKQLLNI